MNESFKAFKVHRLAHIGIMFGMFTNMCFEICSTSNDWMFLLQLQKEKNEFELQCNGMFLLINFENIMKNAMVENKKKFQKSK